MYKNALKEDLIRVVEELDGIVESTDTIVKLKTKIENSSTFESDPDFVKTLIQNCIDERVSQNEREVTSEQKIELAKLQLAKLEKEIELQLAKNKALSLNPAAKVEEKQFETNTENMIQSETYIQFAARLTANFQYYCSLRKVNSFESLCDLIISDKLYETLNKETATHIGIREAEDWFRPIDLAKECDIYISSRSGSHKEIPITYGYTQDPFKIDHKTLNQRLKRTIPNIMKEKIKNCFICGDSSHRARDYSPLVSMEIPLRTAYGQNGRCGMQPKPSSLRAQAHQNSRRTATPLVRLVEGEETWEAPAPRVFSQNWGRNELNRSVTCMVLKATTNDRRQPFAMLNFVGLILVFLLPGGIVTTTTCNDAV
ncbi:DUF1758 domain-containing protein [Trichonephila clavipes]|nr:DUF1758 domain-containing protein [Trichonephila clavipes]